MTIVEVSLVVRGQGKIVGEGSPIRATHEDEHLCSDTVDNGGFLMDLGDTA